MGRAVDIIKGSLTMRDIFAKYGFEQNRAGFIVCPFHSEKTASLGTYANDKRWKCFGCGAGGDVISFVMKLFGLNFSQAVITMTTAITPNPKWIQSWAARPTAATRTEWAIFQVSCRPAKAVPERIKVYCLYLRPSLPRKVKDTPT